MTKSACIVEITYEQYKLTFAIEIDRTVDTETKKFTWMFCNMIGSE